MIDVAHDGDDRRPRPEVFRVVRLLGLGHQFLFDVGRALDLQLAARFQRHRLGRLGVDERVDGHLDGRPGRVELEQNIDGALADGLGERAHGDREVDRHLALARLGRPENLLLLLLDADARLVVGQQADAAATDVVLRLGLALRLAEVALVVAGVAADDAAGAAGAALGAALLLVAALLVVRDLLRDAGDAGRRGTAGCCCWLMVRWISSKVRAGPSRLSISGGMSAILRAPPEGGGGSLAFSGGLGALGGGGMATRYPPGMEAGRPAPGMRLRSRSVGRRAPWSPGRGALDPRLRMGPPGRACGRLGGRTGGGAAGGATGGSAGLAAAGCTGGAEGFSVRGAALRGPWPSPSARTATDERAAPSEARRRARAPALPGPERRARLGRWRWKESVSPEQERRPSAARSGASGRRPPVAGRRDAME